MPENLFFSFAQHNRLQDIFRVQSIECCDFFRILSEKGDVSLLYDKIKELAKKKGIPIYKVESDCGYESGAMCRWNESSPNAKRLKIVADYLGVTVDELLEE